jgi:flagellar biosynthesis/type III secretory pathway chaperone
MPAQNLDAGLCRDHLARLMSDETRLLTELEGLLDNEHAYLNSNDIDGLEHAGAARQTCMGELVRIEDERRSLCRMSGKSADLKGLEDLIRWCDPNGTLKPHWERCAEHATRCRERNDRNGLVVAARLKRVEGMLNIITGRSVQPTTYGPQNAYSQTGTGRMVRSAV